MTIIYHRNINDSVEASERTLGTDPKSLDPVKALSLLKWSSLNVTTIKQSLKNKV
jgi:hypothetical protein